MINLTPHELLHLIPPEQTCNFQGNGVTVPFILNTHLVKYFPMYFVLRKLPVTSVYCKSTSTNQLRIDLSLVSSCRGGFSVWNGGCIYSIFRTWVMANTLIWKIKMHEKCYTFWDASQSFLGRHLDFKTFFFYTGYFEHGRTFFHSQAVFEDINYHVYNFYFYPRYWKASWKALYTHKIQRYKPGVVTGSTGTDPDKSVCIPSNRKATVSSPLSFAKLSIAFMKLSNETVLPIRIPRPNQLRNKRVFSASVLLEFNSWDISVSPIRPTGCKYGTSRCIGSEFSKLTRLLSSAVWYAIMIFWGPVSVLLYSSITKLHTFLATCTEGRDRAGDNYF